MPSKADLADAGIAASVTFRTMSPSSVTLITLLAWGCEPRLVSKILVPGSSRCTRAQDASAGRGRLCCGTSRATSRAAAAAIGPGGVKVLVCAESGCGSDSMMSRSAEVAFIGDPLQ
jgi:hypothetical protein